MQRLIAFGLSASAAILLLAPFALHPARADPKVVEFRLTAKGLACLKKHANVYRKAKKNNLFIPVRDCPRLPATPTLGSLVNEGPGGGPQASTEDTYIYVTKAQFECLIRTRPREARAYRFLPQSCTLDPVR
jgi:hypothetical protein